jgi:type II secretory ATPase GspE/PulE/Tfp pilus assembly ATPase PilB-like protein
MLGILSSKKGLQDGLSPSEASSMPALFKGAPAALLPDMFLSEGTLHIASTQKTNTDLLSFIGLAKLRGVLRYEFLAADVFYAKKSEVEKQTGQYTNEQDFALSLLETAYKAHASDIHIIDNGAYGTILFRIMGLITQHAVLPGGFVRKVIGVIYGTFSSDATTTQHTPSKQQDARISDRRFLPKNVESIRVHTEPIDGSVEGEHVDCCVMALRLLYDAVKVSGSLYERLEILGHNEKDRETYRDLSNRSGISLLSGPVGSGKTTLLKNIMETLASEHPERRFHAIEDPPEYKMDNVTQSRAISNDSKETGEPGSDKRELFFDNLLAGALRIDVNTIMIGEIRYAATVVAALHAALSGHSVYATIHANSALGIISRLEAFLSGIKFAEPMEFLCDPSVIVGLAHQRLIPTLCPNCKMPFEEARKETEYFVKVLPAALLARVRKTVSDLGQVCVRGHGCAECNYIGFSGQTVAAEVIATSYQLLNALRERNTSAAFKYWTSSLNGKTYVRDAIDKMEQGLLDPYMTESKLGLPFTSEIFGKE